MYFIFSQITMLQLLKLLIPDFPKDVSWSSINPKSLINYLSSVSEIGTMKNFFERVLFFDYIII